VKTQSLFWNAFQLNSKTDDGYRVVTVVSSVLSVGAMYTVRYYEDREHEALCSAGEK